MSNQAEDWDVRVQEGRKPCQAEGARGVGMEQHPSPIFCNSLMVFLGQPACRASQTMQARLSTPRLAEKFNSCIFFKPFLLVYRRNRSGRRLLSLALLRTEIVAAVRGGPSLLPSPPPEEAGCGAERLRHPGRRIPGEWLGTLLRCQQCSEPCLPGSRTAAGSHPLRCRFAFLARAAGADAGAPLPRTAALGS